MPKPLARIIEGMTRAEGGEERTFELSISSNAPYERYWGVEILSHDNKSVDLTRLGDGRHPLLLGHDVDKQIGVIRSVSLNPDEGKLRGVAKFSRSPLGQEIMGDVEDGIRTLVSVGYFIEEIEEVDPERNAEGEITGYKTLRTLTGEVFEREMRAQHGEAWERAGVAAARAQGSQPPVYVVTRWQPFEASIVPIPADVTVGVGRSGGPDAEPEAPAVVTPPAAPAAPAPIIIVQETTMTQKTAAELEIERRDAIQALGENPRYSKYLKANDTGDAIRNGVSVDDFKELIFARMESHHTTAGAVNLGMSKDERKRYSLGRALVAHLTNDWREAGFERECSEAVAKIMGRGPEGFFIPPEAFVRDFNVGTGSEAGNLKPTELRTDLYVDVLRNKLVLPTLGVRMLTGLSGDVDMPRKATASVIGSATEIGSASETNPTTAKVTLSPKRQTAYVEVSKQALIQSAMSLEEMIRDDLLSGVAVSLENQAINGVGSNSQMLGLRNTSNIGTTTAGANGGTVSWGIAVGLESACANNNAEPDRLSGYLTNTRQRGNLKQVQKGTNLPFIWDGGEQPVNGYRCAVTNNVPNNLTKGTATTVCSSMMFSSDWSMAVLGLFGAPDVTVDPYTKADTGQVKITLNQFADFGVRQPACFSKVDDLL
jgi:HK97 family phage major capsid protein